MELNGLPEWLDKDIINEVIKNKYDNKNVKILKAEKFCDDDNGGDHYLSEIIYFSVTINNGEIEETARFIMKVMDKGMSELVSQIKGDKKEISMYKDILPYVNKMLTKPISPNMYYELSNKCLILEDLSALGYKIANRIDLLDFDHCKIAFEALAKLHGTSIGLYEVSPHIFEIVGEEMLYNCNKDSIPYYFAMNNLNNVLNMLRELPEGHQYIEDVENLIKTFWDDLVSAINTDHGFNVLNHGDFWTTNILYKYENEKPSDCQIVDYQMTRFCTPTLDIFQFISISMQSSVRENNLSELLDIYVDTLNSTLKSIGSSSNLPRKKLDQMMDDTKVIALQTGLTLAQIALCDPNDPLELAGKSLESFRNGFPEGDPYVKAYKQHHAQQHILSLLKFFRRKNYI